MLKSSGVIVGGSFLGSWGAQESEHGKRVIRVGMLEAQDMLSLWMAQIQLLISGHRPAAYVLSTSSRARSQASPSYTFLAPLSLSRSLPDDCRGLSRPNDSCRKGAAGPALVVLCRALSISTFQRLHAI